MNPSLPGTYVSLMADVVQRLNISPEQLLEGSGIRVEQLSEPFWYLDFDIFNNLLNRAVELTNEPALGVYLGLQMTVSCHGSVGLAVMVSQNLGEALNVMEQFIGLRCPALKPRLETNNGIASLSLDQPMLNFKMGIVGMTFLMVGFAQMSKAITGKNDLKIKAELNYFEPSFLPQVQELLPCEINFNKENNRLIFSEEYLELPLIMADPLAARLAREQCKYDLNKLAAKRGEKNPLTALVRELLFDEVEGFFKMKDVADNLHLTERTLQRQLAKEGTTFQMLMDEVRERFSKKLLNNHEYSISYISEKLGYSDVTHFTRAFKRWTKLTPKQYRNLRESKNID
ncbi:AraC family transcriptional regulator [Acinetobacter sp. NIPH 1958]|uniref:AraC family transcriptional regulator n=1 Tax=unclassified Acinetobacter TaxID=196816 RepID=UPI000519858C|nr:AraC family transcriptional regulator [Acinetobacter sp. ANC 3929]MCH7352252.1 AraC family transcriptional regulator [Acinetobacter sp. NIPH 2023]MCH7356630.1 AraC family transcriptional regulator [Acinetobacter sp. NIPH 1958]MCH7358219.1 AraC family transcriptional regulator [Acinetobacter sp. NIPH 2024]